MTQLQSLIRAIYPTQCVACDAATTDDFGLCGSCWRYTAFIQGTICDACGAPLPGDSDEDNAALRCDDCLRTARPWNRGRAVMGYLGVGRKLVLALKHGDRTDLAQPAARWMVRKAQEVAAPNSLIVPLHRFRLLRRSYNQAAVLANIMGARMLLSVCPDAFLRPKATRPLDRHSKADRFAALQDAISLNTKHADTIKDRPIILLDDVMTSGATLAACSEVCLTADASRVDIVTLARVIKDA